MNICEGADRPKPTCFFLLPSLISPVLFFFSPATLLLCCSASEMRHKTPRFVVLSAFNICVPLPPLSLPPPTFSPLAFQDLCPCLVFVQSSTWAVILFAFLLFYLALLLCITLPATPFFSFIFIVLFSIFSHGLLSPAVPWFNLFFLFLLCQRVRLTSAE